MSTEIQKQIKFDLGGIRRKVQLQLDKESTKLSESEIHFLEIEAISEWIEKTFIEKRPHIHIAYEQNGDFLFHSEKLGNIQVLGLLKMSEHYIIKQNLEKK